MGGALAPFDRRDVSHRAFAPPATRPPMRMGWRDAVFLSWRVAPERIAAVLPPGIELDIFDGSAWVSVVAFSMDRKRIFGGLRVWRGRFAELNVRTYVVRDGVPGIRFLSMDTTSRLVTAIGNVMGMPYRYAQRMRMAPGQVEDQPRGLGRLTFRPVAGAPREASALDRFLAERYVAFVGQGSRVLHVHHAPWPLRDVRVEGLRLGFLEAWVGTREPDHVACSDGVDAGAWYRFRAPAQAGR